MVYLESGELRGHSLVEGGLDNLTNQDRGTSMRTPHSKNYYSSLMLLSLIQIPHMPIVAQAVW